MARGGRGYYAVPAGDDQTPTAERRVATEHDAASAADDDAEQPPVPLSSSDRDDRDGDEMPRQASDGGNGGAAQTSERATEERPPEERADDASGRSCSAVPKRERVADVARVDADESDRKRKDEDADEELPEGFIRIRILDLNGKFFSIACQLEWSVAQLKAKVLESTEVAVNQQRLIYRGRVLEDEKTLDEYKLEDGHTVHLFVRMNQTPDPEPAGGDAGSGASTAGSGAHTLGLGRFDDGVTIVHITSETISSAVFPSDSARRVDPLMLDSPLGNCARRVKLWSSFLLIIYTMKVMGQFALLANDQQMRQEEKNKDDTNGQDRYYDRYDYPPYYNQDPMVSAVELMVHAFGVYVGCVGFKAAHDTDIRPIRFYCRGIVWLAFLTVVEQIYITFQISQSDYPETRIQYPYGPAAPSKDDIISANVFQTIMLVVMWVIAIAHSYAHKAEVARYNESFAAAAMNAVPPAHLPDVV